MLPIGLIGFMLPMVLEEGFYADPPKKPKNKLDQAAARQILKPNTITNLSIIFRSTPLQIQLPALQGCQLNTSYTPFEAERAIEQALLPTIEANRKGNLKNERTYLL
jgi:hypothetical protein